MSSKYPIPELPFLTVLSGQRNTGKTTLLLNLLMRDIFYLHKFDHIVFFCPTYYLQVKFRAIKLPSEQIHTEFSEDTLTDVIEEAKARHSNASGFDPVHTLIVLDDCVSEDGFKKSPGLNMLATSGRHWNISVIILTQYITGVGTVVRKNCDGVFQFYTDSAIEARSLWESYGGHRTEKEFRLMMAQHKPFIMFNRQVGRTDGKGNEVIGIYDANMRRI